MTNKIRACNPVNMKYLLEYREGAFRGMFATLTQSLLQDVEKSINATAEVRSENDGVGELVNGSTGMFSGCIGRVQNNLSDVMTQLTTYPLSTPHVTQGDIFMDSTVQILSAYNPRKGEMQVAQVESSFDSVHPLVWLLCLITFTSTLCVLLTHRYFKTPEDRESDRHLAYRVITHMTRYGSLFSDSGPLEKIVFAYLSFFSLMVILYLSSLICASLVVIPPPDTFKSYQDLLDQKVGLFFYPGADDYVDFKFAPEGSINKKLWDMSVARYSIDLVMFKSQKVRRRLTQLVLERKMVYITDSESSPWNMKLFCSLAVDESRLELATGMINVFGLKAKSLFPLTTQDANAQVLMKGLIMSENLSPALLRLRKTVRKFLESGLPSQIINIVRHADFLDLFLGPSKKNRDIGLIQACEQSILYQPEVELHTVKLINMRNLFSFFICALTFLLLVLIVELMVGSFLRRKKKARAIRRRHWREWR